MNKRVVVGLALALIALAAVLFLRIETASIDYWLGNNLIYRMADGQWETVNFSTNATSPGTNIPINCRNDGSATALFNIVISFKNASCLGSPENPRTQTGWHELNATAGTYLFHLSPKETQSVNVSFLIDNGTQSFSVSLSFWSSQILRVESAQKGVEPWNVVYRSLYYGRFDNSSYAPSLIS